ncbi:hypothetical protein [Streptomyces sp. NPDC087297]|uniref:hypothetical protein n=1 Tax=Streptomyces sp. NPDC087297 TaxID=3365778 RepID=UPI00381858DF
MTAALLPARPAAEPGRPQRRRQGRPAVLTEPEQIEQLLADIAAGATVAEATAVAGLSRTPLYRLRRTDARFAAALSRALRAGREARRAAGPGLQVDEHGTEARYTKRHCPCEPCRVAGSRARTRRRASGRGPANPPAAAAA